MSLRQDTAERLCNCGPSVPPINNNPSAAMPLSVFTELLWKSVYNEGGVYGNKKEFLEAFIELINGTKLGMPGIISMKGSLRDFPEIGIEGNALYIDAEKNTMYYWKDGKGYCQIRGTGSSGAIVEDDIYEALNGKVIFVGGCASEI